MGFPDGGRTGCQSLVQTAGFPYTVITHARARVHGRHMRTPLPPTQAAATVAYLFTLRSRAVTPRANELTLNPHRGTSGRHERALEMGFLQLHLAATTFPLLRPRSPPVGLWTR